MHLTFSTRLSLMIGCLLSISLWWGCRQTDIAAPVAPAPQYKANLSREWMNLAYNTVKSQGLFALDASRLYAYTAITMYESMVHGIPNGRSLSGQLHALRNLPQPDPAKTYDWGIVMCHAVPQVMEAVLPGLNTASQLNMHSLAQRQEDELRRTNGLTDEIISDSKSFADRLADAIIAWSETDNRTGLEQLQYTPPAQGSNPQYWKGSTLNQNFMMPFWWTSRPFVISSYRLCEPEPPFAYSEDPSSAYYKDVEEVYNASFDPEKVAVGRYWANNPGQSGSPAGTWIGIANQLVDQLNLDLATTLRMYVLLASGTRDAFIACWYAKYKFYLQRPVTYIRDVMGHPDWNSAVPTPPYPDYTSGTSVNAGVSSEILTRLFGHRHFYDSQHLDKGFGIRQFKSFKEAGIEAYHSRIYGGVHMRRACEKGFAQGECIADYLWAHLQFEQ